MFSDIKGGLSYAWNATGDFVISTLGIDEASQIKAMNRTAVTEHLQKLSVSQGGAGAAYEWIIKNADMSLAEHRNGILQFFYSSDELQAAAEGGAKHPTSIEFGNMLLDLMFPANGIAANHDRLAGLLAMLVRNGAYDLVHDGEEHLKNEDFTGNIRNAQAHFQAMSTERTQNNVASFAPHLAKIRGIPSVASTSIKITTAAAASSALNPQMPRPVKTSVKQQEVERSVDSREEEEAALERLQAEMMTSPSPVSAMKAPEHRDSTVPSPVLKQKSNPLAILYPQGNSYASAAAGREDRGSPTKEMNDAEMLNAALALSLDVSEEEYEDQQMAGRLQAAEIIVGIAEMVDIEGDRQIAEMNQVGEVLVKAVEITEALGLPAAKAVENEEIPEGKLLEDDMSDKKELDTAPKTYLQYVFGNFLGTPTTGWREVGRVVAMIALTIFTATIAGWVALVCLAIDAYKQRQIDSLNKKDDKFFDGDDEGVLIPNGKTIEGDLPVGTGMDFSDEMMARARFHQEMVMAEAHYNHELSPPSYDAVMAEAQVFQDEEEWVRVLSRQGRSLSEENEFKSSKDY